MVLRATNCHFKQISRSRLAVLLRRRTVVPPSTTGSLNGAIKIPLHTVHVGGRKEFSFYRIQNQKRTINRYESILFKHISMSNYCFYFTYEPLTSGSF